MFKKEIDTIVNSLVNFLVKDKINLETIMTSVKVMKIITETTKLIRESGSFIQEIKNLDRDNSIKRTVEVIKIIINDRRIRNIISQLQVDSIIIILEEENAIVTVIDIADNIVEGTVNIVLETLDDNMDGKVTSTEVSNNCTCCGAKKLANCWGKFVVNFLCCGKNNVKTYQESNNEEKVEETVVEDVVEDVVKDKVEEKVEDVVDDKVEEENKTNFVKTVLLAQTAGDYATIDTASEEEDE